MSEFSERGNRGMSVQLRNKQNFMRFYDYPFFFSRFYASGYGVWIWAQIYGYGQAGPFIYHGTRSGTEWHVACSTLHINAFGSRWLQHQHPS